MDAKTPHPEFEDRGSLESVRDFPLEDMGGMWFRGQSSCSWSLRPGILRHVPEFGLDPVARYENRMYREFRRAAITFFEPSLRQSLAEVYFQAQHSGLPTRLLDWTTNPLAALYFAVEPPACGDEGDAALFALDNAHVAGPAFEDSSRLNACLQALFDEWGPRRGPVKWLTSNDPTCPLPIEPNVRHGRMTQQSSRFTFHFNVDAWPAGALRKWRVPREARRSILYDLESLSVTRATLFPDIDNLARHLSRQIEPSLRSIVFGESLDSAPQHPPVGS